MLAHWKNSPGVDMSLHAELTNLFSYSWMLCPFRVRLGQSGLELTFYHTQFEHANHYTIICWNAGRHQELVSRHYLQFLIFCFHHSWSICRIKPMIWNLWFDLIWFIVFNATFSNISAISWRPVLVVEEAGVLWENHRPWASNW